MVQKLFCGDILRRLRERQKLTQAAFAKTLGMSPSYLNQMENDQRPVTEAVQDKLRSVFEEDLQAFLEGEGRLVAELEEALGDPVFKGGDVTAREIKEAVAVAPNLVRRSLTLFRAYQRSQVDFRALAEKVSHTERVRALEGAHFPYEEVRDFFYYRNNHIDSLDQAAEALHHQCNLRTSEMHVDLEEYLRVRHGVRVVIQGDTADSLRHYDAANKTIYLSELLSPSRRAFHLGNQIALLGFGDLLDAEVAESDMTSDEARAVCRLGLANYFAGALLMPYESFLSTAEKERYDIERLGLKYNTSFEQVCHRLSTLQRPNNKGVPFYFVRVDLAGNISKRQSATSFHFARLGGVCPLWNVHEAFSAQGKVLTQLARMPDDKNYLCIARTVSEGGGGYLRPERKFSVGLGCEISHADKLIYSTGLDLNDPDAVVPIGVSCRVCERDNCAQRAFPPISRRIKLDENQRRFYPYDFETIGEKEAS